MNNHRISILRFDGETAFKSKKFKEYFNDKNITFIPTIPGVHSSLSIVDRLCRTIRDIAFNLNYEGVYTQEMMDNILNYYNTSRHDTLTKILLTSHPNLKSKYPNGISPKDVNNNPYLERLYVTECMKYNFYISTQKDYNLKHNDVVKIINNKQTIPNKNNNRTLLSKDNYKVITKRGNIYELSNTKNNEKIYKPRFELSLV